MNHFPIIGATMRAYAFGIHFITCRRISPGDFLQYLANRAGEQFMFSRQQRVLFVQKADPYYCGLLVSSSDHRHIPLVSRDAEGNVVVRITTPPSDTDPAVLNFFIINPQSGKGIYTAYRGSCSTRMFGRLLNSRYSENVKQSKRELFERIESDNDGKKVSPEQRKAVDAEFKPDFEYTQMVLPENFEERLSRLSRVDSFEFEVPVIEQNAYASMGRYAQTERRSLRFTMEVRNSPRLRRAIEKFIAKEKIDSGKVYGENMDGAPDHVDLDYDFLSLESFDHDEIVSRPNILLRELNASPIIRRLREILDARPLTFGVT